MTDRDYVDEFKLKEECGFTSLNRAAEQDMKGHKRNPNESRSKRQSWKRYYR